MSNLNATLKLSFSCTGPSGESLALPVETVTCPYQAQMQGTVLVPIGTENPDEFDVVFGDIALPTFIWVENRTELEMLFSMNIDAPIACHSIAPGAQFIPVASATAPTDVPVVSMRFTAVGGPSVAAGEISFRVFGDPV